MFRQVSIYMIANIVSALFGFASVVIFTRVLAPEEYGVYIVGFGIAAMISALAFGWIKASVVPFTADESGTDIRATAGSAFLALALLVPALYFGIGAFTPDAKSYLLPAILLAFGIGFFEFYLEIFRARQATGPYLWATILRAALALGLSLILVMLFNWGGVGILSSIALSYFLAAAFYSVLIWRGPRRPFDRSLLRAMLAFGIPMTLSGTVFVFQSMIDRLVVASFLGEHAAGLYGASADLVRQILLFPGVAIGTAVAPIAIRLMAKNDAQAVDRHMVDSTELLLAVLAPAIAGLAIVAPKLAALVLGEDFRLDAGQLIPIVAFAWLFRSVSYQLLHVSFQIQKKAGLMLAQGIAICLISAACLYALVPAFGLIGAAWSIVISEAFGVVIGYALSRLAYPLPIDARPVIKVGLATLGMALPTFFLDRALPGQGPVEIALPILAGIVLYAAAVFGLDIAGIRTRLRARSGTVPAA
ncbi:polysaccharide biosynthesis protein [Devosia soli]|uniref:Polysaccharide biosynthesis protein n=1 Tax=Devosia soli TaxID=361041 RepID=A0A0F5L9H0_9HYPH|nr:oligosaccharide flippase family protein [Devosia soli]KKB78262.1 polysaccharide biosynthesis protein [Devosia soli]